MHACFGFRLEILEPTNPIYSICVDIRPLTPTAVRIMQFSKPGNYNMEHGRNWGTRIRELH